MSVDKLWIGAFAETRACEECGQNYTIQEFYKSSPLSFYPPDDYERGCYTYCLGCWLGVGPNDIAAIEAEIMAERAGSAFSDPPATAPQ